MAIWPSDFGRAGAARGCNEAIQLIPSVWFFITPRPSCPVLFSLSLLLLLCVCVCVCVCESVCAPLRLSEAPNERSTPSSYSFIKRPAYRQDNQWPRVGPRGLRPDPALLYEASDSPLSRFYWVFIRTVSVLRFGSAPSWFCLLTVFAGLQPFTWGLYLFWSSLA